MHNLNSLLDKAVPSKTSQPSEATLQTSTERKRLVAMVWQVLLSRKLVSAPVGSIEHRTFESDMVDLSNQQLTHGMNACKDFVGFFTFPAFRELCRPTAEAMGLPACKVAYVEAAMKSGDSKAVWSHPAVYHAGCETGWFELRTFTESEIYPRWKHNYEKMVNRVMSGEDLSLPVQQALPEKIPEFLSLDENKARLAKLKEML
jgi:hypothetical protein